MTEPLGSTQSGLNVYLSHDKEGGIIYVAFQNEYQGPVQTHPLRDYLNVDIAPDGRIVGMQILGVDTLETEALV